MANDEPSRRSVKPLPSRPAETLCLLQRGLDVTDFDAVSTHFHLQIGSSQKFQRAIMSPK